MPDGDFKLMTPEEIRRFWEHGEQIAAEVRTWPVWLGGKGEDRGKILEEMASDGTEAL